VNCAGAPRPRLELAPLALAAGLLAACATAPGVTRLDPSSLGCMRAVVRDKVPTHIPDKQAHCLAAGMIARYCSPSEAYIAGVGKEFTDLFDGGDAEWGDLVADQMGIRCEGLAPSDAALRSCCATELRRRHLPVAVLPP
jgi:hypothetical protein